MELILWRHAEAEDGIPDAKRPLTERGQKQARKMAKWLRKRLPEDTRIIVSPALRCQQTAAALEREFEASKHVGTSANAGQVLQAAGWPEAQSSVLVVGHQPTLGRLAAMLLTGQEADWTIKKGAIWWLSTAAVGDEASASLRAALGPDLI